MKNRTMFHINLIDSFYIKLKYYNITIQNVYKKDFNLTKIFNIIKFGDKNGSERNKIEKVF